MGTKTRWFRCGGFVILVMSSLHRCDVSCLHCIDVTCHVITASMWRVMSSLHRCDVPCHHCIDTTKTNKTREGTIARIRITDIISVRGSSGVRELARASIASHRKSVVHFILENTFANGPSGANDYSLQNYRQLRIVNLIYDPVPDTSRCSGNILFAQHWFNYSWTVWTNSTAWHTFASFCWIIIILE